MLKVRASYGPTEGYSARQSKKSSSAPLVFSARTGLGGPSGTLVFQAPRDKPATVSSPSRDSPLKHVMSSRLTEKWLTYFLRRQVCPRLALVWSNERTNLINNALGLTDRLLRCRTPLALAGFGRSKTCARTIRLLQQLCCTVKRHPAPQTG